MEQEHPLSWHAIGRIVLTGLAILLVWHTIDIFVGIIIALALSSALFPIVESLSKTLPRALAIIIVLLVLCVPFIALAILAIINIVKEFPHIVTAINTFINHSSFLSQALGTIDIGSYIQNYSSYVLSSTQSILVVSTSILTILFMIFYFLFDYKALSDLSIDLFPKEKRTQIRTTLVDMAAVTGAYIRGNILISAISGLVVFIGLSAFSVPFALPLAIFTAILDLLPLVGSTIGSIPAILFAFTVSPFTGVAVICLYFLYQQAENAFIAPIIYKKALNISSSLTFLAVVIGGSMFGIIGAFVALPIAASIPSLLKLRELYSTT